MARRQPHLSEFPVDLKDLEVVYHAPGHYEFKDVRHGNTYFSVNFSHYVTDTMDNEDLKRIVQAAGLNIAGKLEEIKLVKWDRDPYDYGDDE